MRMPRKALAVVLTTVLLFAMVLEAVAASRDDGWEYRLLSITEDGMAMLVPVTLDELPLDSQSYYATNFPNRFPEQILVPLTYDDEEGGLVLPVFEALGIRWDVGKHTFTGWSLSPYAGEERYTAGDVFQVDEREVILYAQWEVELADSAVPLAGEPAEGEASEPEVITEPTSETEPEQALDVEPVFEPEPDPIYVPETAETEVPEVKPTVVLELEPTEAPQTNAATEEDAVVLLVDFLEEEGDVQGEEVAPLEAPGYSLAGDAPVGYYVGSCNIQLTTQQGGVSYSYKVNDGAEIPYEGTIIFSDAQEYSVVFTARRDGGEELSTAPIVFEVREGRAAIDPGQASIVLAQDEAVTVPVSLLNMPTGKLSFSLEGSVLASGDVSLLEDAPGSYTLAIQAPEDMSGTARIILSASDDYETLSETITVEVQTNGLFVGAVPVQQVAANDTASVSIAAVVENPANVTLAYAITSQPAMGSASIDEAGLLSYTAGNTASQAYVTVQVSGGGESAETTVEFRVVSAPVLHQAEQTLSVEPGGTATVTLASLYDASPNDEITYNIVEDPTQGSVSINRGELTYLASGSLRGEDQFSLSITNAHGSVTQAFRVTADLTFVNLPHTITLAEETVTVQEGEPVTFRFTIDDFDGVDMENDYAISLSASNTDIFPSDTVFEQSITATGATQATVVIAAQPAAYAHGECIINILVSDGEHEATATQRVIIESVNDNPVISGLPETDSVNEDNPYQVDFIVSDPDIVDFAANLTVQVTSDNDTVIKSCEAALAEVVSSTTARYTLTVTPHDNMHAEDGVNITVTVFDDENGNDTKVLVLTINPVNDAHTLTLAQPEVTSQEDDPVAFTYAIEDVDCDDMLAGYTIAYESSNPAVILDDATYTEIKTPDGETKLSVSVSVQPVQYANTEDHGDTWITITVSDEDNTQTERQQIIITAVDNAPEIVGIPESGTIEEDGTYKVSFTVKYPDAVNVLEDLTVTATAADDAIIKSSEISSPTMIDTRTAAYTLTVQPHDDRNAEDGVSIDVTATAANGLSSTASVLLHITPVNDPHTITLEAETVTSDEDTPVTFRFFLDDIDCDNMQDGYTITFATTNAAVLATDAVYTATSKADGPTRLAIEVTVQPVPYANTEEYGDAAVTITVSDADNTVTAAQHLVILPINNPPEISGLPTEAEIDEDGYYIATFSVYDPDVSDPLDGFDITVSAPDGTVLPSSSFDLSAPTRVDDRTAKYTLTITPLENANAAEGIDITVLADDRNGGTDSAVLRLVITPVNDDPVVLDDSFTINEDIPTRFDVLENDSDVEGHDTITIVAVGTSSIGAVIDIIEEGRAIWYTPPENYFGSDTFTYTIEDGGQVQATATVSVEIKAVNDLPEFLDVNLTGVPYETKEDTPFTITIRVTDVETADSALMLQATVVQNANGVLQQPIVSLGNALDERVISITPVKDRNGTAVIRLTLSDGEGVSEHDITVLVEAVNDLPVAENDTVAFNEDEPVRIAISTLMANDTDVDIATNGDAISFVSYTPVQPHGTLDPEYGEGGELVALIFTPAENDERNASFTYTITDTEGDTATATVTLICTPHNDAPTIEDIDDQEMDEDAENELAVPLVYADPETPNDKLVITVGSSDPAIVTSSGLRVQDGVLYIQPLPNQNGEVTITVRISDGEKEAFTEFLLKIEAKPDDPVAMDDTYDAIAGRTILLRPLENDYEVDGETFALQSYTLPDGFDPDWIEDNGNGTLTFTAPAGTEGTFVIPYTIMDDSGAKGSATITLNVTAFGIGPMVMQVSPIVMSMGDPVDIALQVVNIPAGEAYTLVVTASDGTLLPEDSLTILGLDTLTPTLRIDPSKAGGVGSTVLTLTLTYKDAEDTVSVPITLSRVNNAPTADDDSYSFEEGKSFRMEVLKNDTDVEQPVDLKLYGIVSQPHYGTVEISGDRQTILYTPPSAHNGSYFNGTQTFEYAIVDGGGLTSTATVTMVVTPVKTNPYAYGDYRVSGGITLGSEVTVSNIMNNDYDNDDWTYGESIPPLSGNPDAKIVNLVASGHGCTPTLLEDGRTFTFEPTKTDWYTFTYSVTTPDADGTTATSNTATVHVGVSIANEPLPPRLSGNTYYANEDCEAVTVDITGLVHATDFSAVTVVEDSIAFSPDTILEYVSITRDGDKINLRYKPSPDANGRTTIQWKVNQAGVEESSNTGTIYVHIHAINDPPELAVGTTPSTVYRGQEVQVPLTIHDVDNVYSDLLFTITSSDDLLIPGENITIAPGEGEDAYILTFRPLQVYAPGEGDNNVTINIRVHDGAAADEDSFTVTVEPLNHTPVAQALEVVTIHEDGQGEFNVVSWGSDEDGDLLSIICDPAKDSSTGIFYANTEKAGFADIVGKKIIYSPANNHYTVGDDDYIEVRYKLMDTSDAVSNLGVIRIHIDPVNDAPQMYGLQNSYAMVEDTPLIITFTARDVDMDDLEVTAESDDADGSYIDRFEVQQEEKGEGEYLVTLTIYPVQDAFHPTGASPVTVTVKATDTGNATGEQRFDLTITPVNDAVRLKEGFSDPHRITIDEDTPTPIDLIAMFEDVEGDAISIIKLEGAVHGTIVNRDGVAYFTPTKDFCHTQPIDGVADNDLAAFTYTVSDIYEGSASGTVYIYVNPVNDKPVAGNRTITILEDETTSFIVSDLVSDVDNELKDLTITLDNNIANGTVTSEDGVNFLYTPNRDWNGTETIRYTVTDPALASATGTVTIIVQSVVDDPRLTFDTDNGWDYESQDGDSIHWSMDEDTPTEFALRVWQPEVGLNPSLTIQISAMDTANLIPRENIELLGSGEYLRVRLTSGENLYGTVQLCFVVTDGTRVVTRYVDVTVNSVNDLPEMSGLASTGEGTSLLYNLSASVDEDKSVSGTVSGTDVETAASDLAYSVSVQPGHGTASIARDSGSSTRWKWTYTPSANYYGPDSFRIAVTDEDGGVREAVVSVTVKPINDPPTVPAAVTLDRSHYRDDDDITVTVSAGSDIETALEDLSYELQVSYDGSAWKALGTITPGGATGTYTFKPETGKNTASLQVRARTWDTVVDGAAPILSSSWKASGKHSIDNTVPGATHSLSPSGDTNADVVITVKPTDTGTGASGVSTVAIDGTTLGAGYTHTVKVNGTYTFTITDNVGNSFAYPVKIDNIDKLDPDIAADTLSIDDSGKVYADTGRKILLTYTDAIGTAEYKQSGVQTSQYELTESDTPSGSYVSYGSSVALTKRGIWYIHARVVDKAGNEIKKTFGPYVVLNSVPKADAPNVPATVQEGPGTSVTFNLLDYVQDADGIGTVTATMELGQNATYGELTKVGDTTYTFTHNGKGDDIPFNNLLEFTFSATDDDGESYAGTVPVTVVEVNDLPDAPSGVRLSGDYYQDGSTLVLTWGPGADEETATASLRYEIEVQYSASDGWRPIPTTAAAGAQSHTFIIDSNGMSSDSMRLRVRTVDAGINNDPSTARESDWAHSPLYILDNMALGMTDALSPSTYTSGEVVISLTPQNVGGSGIASLKHGEQTLTESGGSYRFPECHVCWSVDNLTIVKEHLGFRVARIVVKQNSYSVSNLGSADRMSHALLFYGSEHWVTLLSHKHIGVDNA